MIERAENRLIWGLNSTHRHEFQFLVAQIFYALDLQQALLDFLSFFQSLPIAEKQSWYRWPSLVPPSLSLFNSLSLSLSFSLSLSRSLTLSLSLSLSLSISLSLFLSLSLSLSNLPAKHRELRFSTPSGWSTHTLHKQATAFCNWFSNNKMIKNI